jgi:tellurite resistance protein TerA
MEKLVQGQNTVLASSALSAKLTCDIPRAAQVLEISGFLLDKDGRVPGDPEFVFFNQPDHPSGCLRIDVAATTFSLDLDVVPSTIEKIVIAATLDLNVAGAGVTFGDASKADLSIRGGLSEIDFELTTNGMRETALILGEFYQRNNAWKFRALGHGFNGGLEPLAKQYGVDVSTPAAPAPAPTRPPASAPIPTPTPTPRSAPSEETPNRDSNINLSKIRLEKRQAISLEKRPGGYGEITLNLNWRQEQKSGGLLSGLFSKKSGIDLDLGCMIEYQNVEDVDEQPKFVIQALGNAFGDYGGPPWIQHMGDDRTGSTATGETIRVNGQQWQFFKRILVFAFIYEGIQKWSDAQAVVVIKTPGEPDLEAHLDSHDNTKTMCAIATLDNDAGSIRATKLVDYYRDHKDMDEALGFGFRWTAGSK